MARGDDVRAGLTQPRRFGTTVGGMFLLLASIAWWRGHPLLAGSLAAAGVPLLLLGIVAPALLVPVERTWMRGSHAISRVTTPLVMGIVYLLVVTPIGFLMRRLSGDPLQHRGSDSSFWVPRDREAGRRGDLTRQF